SAPTMRGAASDVAPARADLRKLRRFTSVSLRRILTLLAPPVPLGNQPRATLSAYPAFPYRALLLFLPSPRDAPLEPDGTRPCCRGHRRGAGTYQHPIAHLDIALGKKPVSRREWH